MDSGLKMLIEPIQYWAYLVACGKLGLQKKICQLPSFESRVVVVMIDKPDHFLLLADPTTRRIRIFRFELPPDVSSL